MKRELLPKETILKNRYCIVSIIAPGGMGAVYRAFDQDQQKQVAIKENYFNSKEGTAQFKTEADVLRRLRHPGLPSVTEDFTENESQYLVMELIEGQDLAQIIKENGPLSQEQALDAIIQICRVVDYLHRQNIIHRDIKPQNIKMTHKGQAMLVDFGIAKIAEDGGQTSLGAKAVTKGYSPPEQYSGRTNARSDIYALGATLYTLLTGQTPPASTERSIGTESFVPPEKITPGLNPALSQAIVHAMELIPDKRPKSVADWQETLEQIRKGNIKLYRPEPEPIQRVRPAPLPSPQTSPVWKWIGLAMIGLIVIGSVVLFWPSGYEDATAQESPTVTSTAIEHSEPTATHTPAAIAGSAFTPTATATPSPTEASASETIGTVTANIPIYEDPSNQADTIERFTEGQQVRIVSRTRDDQWLEIDEPTKGWVMVQFIEIDGSLADVPTSTVVLPTPTLTLPPTATPSPAPSLVGPVQLTLGRGCGFYTLRTGGNQWFTFFSGENNTAMIVAFIQNETAVELFVYDQDQIVNGRLPANPDDVAHLALLTPNNGRDRNANTKDIVWAGGVTPQTQYYIRIANRSSNTISYSLAPSDVFSCP